MFERADRIGGLMMYGIPAMKLDKGIVSAGSSCWPRRASSFSHQHRGRQELSDREAAQGIRRRRAVRRRHRAARSARRGPRARGRSLRHGVPDRQHQAPARRRQADGGFISAKDKNVIVIGGGDTGTDCVGTSLRHGCKSLVQLELLARPPETRAADNPWPQWPKIYRVDYGQEEAAAIFGKDPAPIQGANQAPSWRRQGPCARHRGRGGALRRPASGPPKIEEVPGTVRVLPADLVLLAMGFLGPEKPGLLADLGVKLDGRGNVAVDANKQTSVPGVFAAGDMSRGQSLVVWAIAEGRDAAIGIDRFLMGDTVLD